MRTSLARYPDLTGKTAIVGSADPTRLIEVARLLAANDMHLALVCSDRRALDAAVAEAGDRAVYAVAGDPADPQLWERIVPHVEQRLGPIDVVVAIGTPRRRRPLLAATTPDMQRRGRGVAVEVGRSPRALTVTIRSSGDPSRAADRHSQHGVRWRHVVAPPTGDVGAAVLLCCSDALTAIEVTIRLA